MNNINRRMIRKNGSSYMFNVKRPQKSEINFFKKVKKVNPVNIAQKTALMSVIEDIETLRINCVIRGHKFNRPKVVTLLKRIYFLNDLQINRVISVYKNYLHKN